MAKGGSGVKGGGGGFAKSVTVQSGDLADLSAFPLKYGSIDGSLTDEQRAAVEAFEKKHLSNKIEFGAIIAEDGVILRQAKGGNGSVRISSYGISEDTVLTHNHPRGKDEQGCLGGTFSRNDIVVFTTEPATTMRASAAEGVYSIHKSNGFDGKGLRGHYKNVMAQAEKGYTARNSEILSESTKRYDAVKIGESGWERRANEYNSWVRGRYAENFNHYLVDLHNGLLAGQKQYGYTYTLERRK